MHIQIEHHSTPQTHERGDAQNLLENLLEDIERMRVKLKRCRQALQPALENEPDDEDARNLPADGHAPLPDAPVSPERSPYPPFRQDDPALPEGTVPPGQELPEGFSGAALVELEEIRRQEEALCAFVLERARSLAWQAVRHTPGNSSCAELCQNWIRQARLWAGRRQLDELSASLAELEACLEQGLPRLVF